MNMTEYASARFRANDEWLAGFKLPDRVKMLILSRFDTEMFDAVLNATENIKAMLEAPWSIAEQIAESLREIEIEKQGGPTGGARPIL